VTSEDEISEEVQTLIDRGNGIIDHQRGNIAKLNELKDKLSSSKDRVEFVKIR
jgi:hypothetical protein